MTNPAAIKIKIKQNSQTLDVLSTADLINAWEKTTAKDIAQHIGETTRAGANYVSAVLDTKTATSLIKDLGHDGKVILKNINGKQYVIFKGLAGNRSIFTGTRYLASNPKIVDMAIGKVGANRAIISGARITIFIVVPLNVLNYILNDRQTMSQLFGITATDLFKVGAASAIASLAATTTATLTTLVAGPIVVAIVVGIATALALDALDKKFGVTDALIKAIDDTYDSTFGEINRQLQQVDRRLKWQIMNGQPVGQGIFY